MAKNIDFMGAVFPDVPSIRLPQQGGGLVSFDDTTDADATAADIASGKTAYVNGTKITGTASGGGATIEALNVTQNGTYTASGGVDGYSPVTVNVSGGGGASNIVTGTFKGTTKGAAMDVTLNYSGSGYPIAIMIYPSEGSYNSSGAFYSLIQRYACEQYLAVKNKFDTTPSWEGWSNSDKMFIIQSYKGSASNAQNFSQRMTTTAVVLKNTAASESVQIVQIKSKTSMSVFIANTSYGFADNIEYTYWVMYSS